MTRTWLPVLVLSAVACGGGSPTVAPPAPSPSTSEPPATFTATGTLQLSGGSFYPKGKPCSGSDGYDDIQAGAQVVVRDGDGTSVGLGSLGPGVSDKRFSVYCVFPFEVPDIPSGGGIYSVEVAHRGQVEFQEADADRLQLTLG